MQILGTFHKRKSVEKVIPQMPQRKISENSRQKSRRNNRTQYKGLESPQLQLKSYKRKNFKILTQLQTSANSGSSKNLKTVSTKKTFQRSNNVESQEKSIQQLRNETYSINSFKRQKTQQKGPKNQNQEITSRFAQDHHKTQQSLSFLINHTKSKDSNPLINTARLKQQQFKSFHKIHPSKQKTSNQNQKYQHNSSKNQYSLNTAFNKNNPINTPFSQIKIINPIQTDKMIEQNTQLNLNTQLISKAHLPKQSEQQMNQKSSNSNINEEDYQNQENQQNQSNQAQNFDDYEFGGKNSGSVAQSYQETSVPKSNKKGKNKKLMPPPKVQSYCNDLLNLQKPQNWRQLNRYIPRTQQQNRMAQQHFVKEKQKLVIRRQQQQIMKLIQQYQINKNSLNIATKRKIQTNSVMQTIYKNKKHQQKHSSSLPLLKVKISQPKKQIIVPEHSQIYADTNINSGQQKYKIKNLLAKSFQHNQNQKLNRNIRHSLSYNKLGFGVRQSRNLYEDQIKQSQIQNVQKIQRKLRQKGIEFNPQSMRKGFLNLRDLPAYKISTNNMQLSSNQDGKLEIPEKQLPSNAFYKIFPL